MKKPKIFVQQCGSYTNEILVICGATKQETFKFLKKINALKNFVFWVIHDFDEWDSLIKKDKTGLFCFNSDVCGGVIFLRPVKDEWEYWETLLHELHHATLHIAKQRQFLEEFENQAHLFEFLFKNIRRKISGIDPV